MQDCEAEHRRGAVGGVGVAGAPAVRSECGSLGHVLASRARTLVRLPATFMAS